MYHAIVVIKNINGYRIVAIKIDGGVQKEYFDEAKNVSFHNLQLGQDAIKIYLFGYIMGYI